MTSILTDFGGVLDVVSSSHFQDVETKSSALWRQGRFYWCHAHQFLISSQFVECFYLTCSWCIPAPVLIFIHVTLSHIRHIHFSCCGTPLFILWVSSLSSWCGTQNFYFLRGSHYSSLFTILDSEDQISTLRHLVIDSTLGSLDAWEESSLASHWTCTRHCDILCTGKHTLGVKSPVIEYLQ